MDQSECSGRRHCEPWNKGKLVGQKAPLRLKEIWAIRIRLQSAERVPELALFNLAVDSKLRSCDLVKLRVKDVTRGDRVAPRAIVMQQKTGPVQFEITEQTRESVAAWISHPRRRPGIFCFPVACNRPLIFRRVSTLGSCGNGSERLDTIRRHMAPIQCAAPKQH
jgi:integrase